MALANEQFQVSMRLQAGFSPHRSHTEAVLCVAIQVVNIPISTANIDAFRKAQMTRSEKLDTDLEEHYHILQTWSLYSTQSNRDDVKKYSVPI